VRHHASPAFWACYDALPAPVRAVADKQFALMKVDPRHPSLRLKRVGRFHSARVGAGYRVLGVDAEDGIVWFWIGSHAEYDRLVSR
jgi:hypothetical protein